MKAASIIVEYDDKHFRYNPIVLRDLDNNSHHSEEELNEERLLLTGCKAAINLSLQSSTSQTFNQQRQTEHTDGHPTNNSPEAALDYE